MQCACSRRLPRLPSGRRTKLEPDAARRVGYKPHRERQPFYRSTAPMLLTETKMKKPILLLLAAILTMSTSVTLAQEDHAYTQGPVVVVSFVRTEPGMFEDYMRYLDTTYKRLFDEYKKQGIVTDYAVYQALPRDPQDADLILTVTYKNMAALDSVQAKTDPLIKEL